MQDKSKVYGEYVHSLCKFFTSSATIVIQAAATATAKITMTTIAATALTTMTITTITTISNEWIASHPSCDSQKKLYNNWIMRFSTIHGETLWWHEHLHFGAASHAVATNQFTTSFNLHGCGITPYSPSCDMHMCFFMQAVDKFLCRRLHILLCLYLYFTTFFSKPSKLHALDCCSHKWPNSSSQQHGFALHGDWEV